MNGVLVILSADDVINGENEVDTLCSCLFNCRLCNVELVVFSDGSTDVLTESLEERVSHTAADDKRINLVYKVFDNADLI